MLGLGRGSRPTFIPRWPEECPSSPVDDDTHSVWGAQGARARAHDGCLSAKTRDGEKNALPCPTDVRRRRAHHDGSWTGYLASPLRRSHLLPSGVVSTSGAQLQRARAVRIAPHPPGPTKIVASTFPTRRPVVESAGRAAFQCSMYAHARVHDNCLPPPLLPAPRAVSQGPRTCVCTASF